MGGGVAGKAGQSGASGGSNHPPGKPVVYCGAPGVTTPAPSGGSCLPIDDSFVCSPVTNQGCPEGKGCDFAGGGTSSCFPTPNAPQICEECNPQAGIFCDDGLHCYRGTNVCARYCCTDADCGPEAYCGLDVVLPVKLQEYGVGICVTYEETGGMGGAGGSSAVTISQPCQGCIQSACGTEFFACAQQAECANCALLDSSKPQCKTNQAFQAAVACACKADTCETGTCMGDCATLKSLGIVGAGGAAGASGAAGAGGTAGAGTGGAAGLGGEAGAGAGGDSGQAGMGAGQAGVSNGGSAGG